MESRSGKARGMCVAYWFTGSSEIVPVRRYIPPMGAIASGVLPVVNDSESSSDFGVVSGSSPSQTSQSSLRACPASVDSKEAFDRDRRERPE